MGKCRTPGYTVRTSKFGLGPPHVRSGPLEWDLDPSYGVRAAHSRVPRFQDITHPGFNQGLGGGPVPTRVRTCPHTLMFPAQAETRCCHVAYYARHKPTGGTWHDASGLRAPSHSLQIRRAPVHSTDRRRAQSTIRGPRNYSHVTISRAITHHYSCELLPINAAWTVIIITSADYSYVTLSALVIPHNVFVPLCS
jgi:hypothetical protein